MNNYPDDYLKCPVCRVAKKDWCVSRSGKVVGGRPDGVQIELEAPHKARKVSRRKLR